MTKPINALMQKQMTRAEFLATLGLGLVSVVGFGRIVELFTGHSIHKKISGDLGYSNGNYGGSKPSQLVAKKVA